MTTLRNLSIRQVLLTGIAITGATALLMLLGAPLIDDLLDVPAALLAGAGAVLIPYVGYLFWLANRDAAPRAGIGVAIAANLAWAIGCVALLVAGWVDPNGLGVAFILLNAVVVIVFAELLVLTSLGNRSNTAPAELSLEV